MQEVMDMIVRGNDYRTQSPTEANATSSRSHAVLQINVSQRDRNADISEPHTMATLSIIDLAGSERASATKNRGERLTEGANINKSLLALGSCINALCDPRRRNHVPYRNSKLTRLLKFSLGGNCKTVMIVCVSPSSAHFDETQNTLRYANRAKNIQTKVTKNVYNVNRHVKDFLKKIDEQMTLINELKAQQKDQENIAFSKFKKQEEKKEAIIREGVARLRNSFDHCQGDRQERVGSVKKLRQIEKRIASLSSWITAFDYVCEARDDKEPPRNLKTMRKTACGILMELEQSRSHYHQRLAKTDWQRPIDTALQTGLKQLQEIDTAADQKDKEALQREAELLKSSAERELHLAVLEQDKENDSTLMRILLRAHFDIVCIVDQLLALPEDEAIAKGKDFLGRILNSCTEATDNVVKPDSSMPIMEAFPPTKSGTPKRKRTENLMKSSPLKDSSLAPPIQNMTRFSGSPAKASPKRRVKFGTPRKGVSFTPKKKSPTKRAVRWRDDTEDGTLAEWSRTPQKQESTPAAASFDDAEEEMPPKPCPEYLHESDTNSSPMPTPPTTSVEPKPKAGRFQAGFLARKGKGSPHSNVMQASSSSPEPSPLQEVAINKIFGRQSGGLVSLPAHSEVLKENHNDNSSTESADDETRYVKSAIKRASMSRRQSIRDSERVHRRRSPPHAVSTTSPNNENAYFSTSHARRLGRSEKDVSARHSVLSPRLSQMTKSEPMSARRATMSEDRTQKVGMSGSSNRASGNAFLGNAGRGSLAHKPKTVWR